MTGVRIKMEWPVSLQAEAESRVPGVCGGRDPDTWVPEKTLSGTQAYPQAPTTFRGKPFCKDALQQGSAQRPLLSSTAIERNFCFEIFSLVLSLKPSPGAENMARDNAHH